MFRFLLLINSLFLATALPWGIAHGQNNVSQNQSSAVEAEINRLLGVEKPQAVAPIAVSAAAVAPSVPVKQTLLDAVDLKDMDINDVLKLIASKTGLNIIAGKNVAGRVTIFLQNVEVHDALHIILNANDLAYVESRGVIQVLPAADFERIYGYKFGQVTETRIIPLKGFKAADAVALLTQMKSTVGKVMADEQSNTLMIEDLPAKVRDMEQYLKTIDAPVETRMFVVRQVSVDALTARINELLTPKVGTARVDAPSNKVFVTDTAKKILEITKLIQQLDVPRVTEVFVISYAKAEDMLKAITPMLTKELGHGEFDARGNKLVVTDVAPKIAEIRKVIAALDHQEQEVLIEAKIIQVTLTDKFKLGVNWDAIVEKWHDLRFTNDYSLGASATPKGVMSIGTIDNDQYKAVLEALDNSGLTKILSSPRIATINNQEAKILVGTTKPYVTTTTTTPGTGPATTAETVSFIDVGVKLNVTPTIHHDGYITMKIKPEVSSAADKITTGNGNDIPIVKTSTVETTVRVKDGVTIIIGGLINEEVANDRNQVPMLGKIPLVGAAFRKDSKSTEKTEMVVFLTPHIITGDVASPPDFVPTIKRDELY